MINEELKKIWRGQSIESIVESIQLIHTETGLKHNFLKFPEPMDLKLENGTVETFEPANFLLGLPKWEQNGSMDFSLTFGLVGLKYIKEVENIIENSNEKIKIIYRIYTTESFNYPAIKVPYIFTVSNISIEDRTISFSGLMLEEIDKTVPGLKYEQTIFRGLKYL